MFSDFCSLVLVGSLLKNRVWKSSMFQIRPPPTGHHHLPKMRCCFKNIQKMVAKLLKLKVCTPPLRFQNQKNSFSKKIITIRHLTGWIVPKCSRFPCQFLPTKLRWDWKSHPGNLWLLPGKIASFVSEKRRCNCRHGKNLRGKQKRLLCHLSTPQTKTVDGINDPKFSNTKEKTQNPVDPKKPYTDTTKML